MWILIQSIWMGMHNQYWFEQSISVCCLKGVVATNDLLINSLRHLLTQSPTNCSFQDFTFGSICRYLCHHVERGEGRSVSFMGHCEDMSNETILKRYTLIANKIVFPTIALCYRFKISEVTLKNQGHVWELVFVFFVSM